MPLSQTEKSSLQSSVATLTAQVNALVPDTVAPPATSPDGTKVPPASFLVDAAGATWTLGAGGQPGGSMVLKNGVQWAGGSGVLLEWIRSAVYVLNSASTWYIVTTDGYQRTTDPNDPIIDPPPVTPPVTPPAGTLPSLGSDMVSGKRNNGLVDFIDVSKIKPPRPWNIFIDDKYTICRSMNGVEPIGYKRLSVWGSGGGLYVKKPLMLAGAIVQNGPADVITFPDGIIPSLKELGSYRSGVRGRAISTPFTTVHGHSRFKEDGTLTSEGLVVPANIGIVADGTMCFYFRDGAIQFPFRVALESYAMDFSYHLPRSDLKFWVVDSGVGKVLRCDRNTGASEIWCTGLGRATSCREVGGTLYVADETNGFVWAVSTTQPDTKSILVHIPGAFFIDYFSDGKLCVLNNKLEIWVVDPKTGVVDGQLMPENLVRPAGQVWQTIDVDRAGGMGARDSFVVITSIGPSNTDCWRISRGGVLYDQNTPQGMATNYGFIAVGNNMQCMDGSGGHYPWIFAHHPDGEGAMTQGMANVDPVWIAPVHPADTWNPGSYGQYESLIEQGWLEWTGNGIWPWTDSNMPKDVPNWATQVNDRGGSQLWSFDDIGEMAFADAEAFIRGGGIGSWPRSYTHDRLSALMYFSYRNSMAYLRDGDAVMARLRSYLGIA
jgi:hypothetical protein